jgi:hypothetical protein
MSKTAQVVSSGERRANGVLYRQSRQTAAFFVQIDAGYRSLSAAAVCFKAPGSLAARYLDTPAQ